MTEKSLHGKQPSPERLAPVIRALGVVTIAAATLFGCAKPQTLILTEVSADPTVPPLLVLQYWVARAADPMHPATASVVSLVPGDAADGRAFYTFPMVLPMGPFPGWSGTVEITLDGRDWETDKIVASGKTTAEIVPEQQTRAALTLTAVSDPGGADGGTSGDAGADTTADAATDS
jgi:hypothetical protein